MSSENVTKRQHLRLELVEQTQQLERVNTVMDVLRHGTGEQATSTLARLRMGYSVEDEYNLIELRAQSDQDPQIPHCATPQIINGPHPLTNSASADATEQYYGFPEAEDTGVSPSAQSTSTTWTTLEANARGAPDGQHANQMEPQSAEWGIGLHSPIWNQQLAWIPSDVDEPTPEVLNGNPMIPVYR